MNACGKTRFKAWSGKAGQRRVYVQGRFCRGVSRHADGAYFVAGEGGLVEVASGQGEKRQVAAEIVGRSFGVLGTSFDEFFAAHNG